MNVFRHNHIPDTVEPIAPVCLLQRIFEQIAQERAIQISKPMVATEGYKVQVTRLLIPLQPTYHAGIILQSIRTGDPSFPPSPSHRSSKPPPSGWTTWRPTRPGRPACCPSPPKCCLPPPPAIFSV